jgi:hypothetical protein
MTPPQQEKSVPAERISRDALDKATLTADSQPIVCGVNGSITTTSAPCVQVAESDTRQRQHTVEVRVSPRDVALSEGSRRVGESPTRKPLSESHADAYHYIYFVYGRSKKSSRSIEVFYEYSHALTAVNSYPSKIDAGHDLTATTAAQEGA